MAVDVVDLASESEAFQLAGWALETGLWNGRPVSWETASIFHEQVQSRLIGCIESDLPSQALDQFKTSLAWIGSSQADKVWLAKEIETLHFSGKDQIMPAGFWKSTKKFWKKHKKEIIIGAVIVTLAIVISVAAVSYAGVGAVAVGAASKDDKNAKLSKNPSDTDIASQRTVQEAASSNAPLEEILPSQVVFSQDGIAIGSQYASYEDILVGNHPESLGLQDISAQRSWFASVCETIGKGMCDPELLNSEDSFPMPEFSRIITAENKGRAGPRIIGINGINNSYDEALANMEYSKSFSPNINHEWVYNNSHGPIVDISEVVILNYHGISPNTANLLRDSIERFHQDNLDLPHEKCIVKCHSQGAVHVRNALEAMPEHLRQRAIVIAIAPAVVVPRDLCYQSYNFACESDIVPRGELCVAVVKDVLSTLAPEIDQVPGTPEIWSRTHKVLEYREELIMLEPDSNCNESVHSFKNSMYADKIEKIMQDYIKRNGEYNE